MLRLMLNRHKEVRNRLRQEFNIVKVIYHRDTESTEQEAQYHRLQATCCESDNSRFVFISVQHTGCRHCAAAGTAAVRFRMSRFPLCTALLCALGASVAKASPAETKASRGGNWPQRSQSAQSRKHSLNGCKQRAANRTIRGLCLFQSSTPVAGNVLRLGQPRPVSTFPLSALPLPFSVLSVPLWLKLHGQF